MRAEGFGGETWWAGWRGVRRAFLLCLLHPSHGHLVVLGGMTSVIERVRLSKQSLVVAVMLMIYCVSSTAIQCVSHVKPQSVSHVEHDRITIIESRTTSEQLRDRHQE